MDDNSNLKNLRSPKMIVKILRPHQNKPDIEPIKIIEPFKSEVVLFDNPEDFTEYYRTHEDEFKGISTVLLNRKYKIPGYRITQKKKTKEDESQELSLRKDYYGAKSSDISCDDKDLAERITKIENSVSDLRKEIDNIIKYLQGDNQ